MTAEIVRFPGAPAPDDQGAAFVREEAPRDHLVGMLRWYADEIAAGRIDPVAAVLVLHQGEHHLPEVIGGGQNLSRLELAGLLAQAQLRAQAVAFRGAHVTP